MLIISRRLGESFFIGDDITVTITGIQDGQVRLGIQAPKSFTVLREEIRDKMIAHGEPLVMKSHKERCDDFNAKHRPGVKVRVKDQVAHFRTSALAYVRGHQGACVFVNGLGAVGLSDVEVVE